MLHWFAKVVGHTWLPLYSAFGLCMGRSMPVRWKFAIKDRITSVAVT